MSRIRVFPFSPKLQRTTAACAVSAAPSTVSQRRDWAAYCVVTHMTPWKFVTRNTQQTLWLSSGVFSRKPSSSLDYSFTITLPVEPKLLAGPAHPGSIYIGITHSFLRSTLYMNVSMKFGCVYEFCTIGYSSVIIFNFSHKLSRFRYFLQLSHPLE